MFRVLLYELFETDVVGSQFADAVENAALTGVEEGEVLGHLRQRRCDETKTKRKVVRGTQGMKSEHVPVLKFTRAKGEVNGVLLSS